MKSVDSIASTVSYSRDLINAGISGIRKQGQTDLAGESFSELVEESLLVSAKLATVGAFAGFLSSYMLHRRHRLSKTVACGALGFCAGLAWSTRKVSSSLASSAAREIDKVRDQHWLELHPIDYA